MDYPTGPENLLRQIFGNDHEKENTMKTSTYARKTFNVKAVQVTEENMAEVANWCGGEMRMTRPKPKDDRQPTPYIYVNVERALNERQRRAFVGDWVLQRPGHEGFKVYLDKAFEKSFDAVNESSDAPYMVG